MAPTLLVLALLLAVFSLAVPAYRAGREVEDRFGFLPNDRPPTDHEAFLNLAGRYAVSSSEYNDVLFVGDSGCLVGIDPLRFEAASGLRAYNLGTSRATGMDGTYVLLSAYFSHHPAPKAVVFAHTPDGLDFNEVAPEVRASRNRFAQVFGTDDQLAGVTPAERYERYRATVSLGAHALWTRATGDGDDLLEQPVRYGLGYRALERYTAASRGFFPLRGPKATRIRDWLRPGQPFVLDKGVDAGFRALAALAAQHGTVVVVRLTPICADAGPKDFAPLESWLRQVAAESPNVRVVHPVVLTYERPLCWDITHVNASGVQAFTEDLAREVRAAMASAPEG